MIAGGFAVSMARLQFMFCFLILALLGGAFDGRAAGGRSSIHQHQEDSCPN